MKRVASAAVALRDEGGRRRRRHGDSIPHSGHIEDHLPFGRSQHGGSPQESDHNALPSRVRAAAHGTPQRDGGQVTDGQGQGVGHVGRARWCGQTQDVGHHALHLILGGGPIPDQGLLDLVGGVLRHLASGLGGSDQGQPAGLARPTWPS